MATALVAAPVGFTAFVVAHVALFHARPVERRSQAILGLFVAAVAVVAVTVTVLASALAAVYAIVLMASAFILYMPLYYTIDTSVSVRTMLELEATPRGLTREELVARYRLDWMVSRRLETMAVNGYLVQTDERFTVTPRGRMVARVFAAVKTAAQLGPGG